MRDESGRETLLASLDRIRARANKLENELIELHNIVRFDHTSAGARERTHKLEGEIEQLTEALRHFRRHVDGE